MCECLVVKIKEENEDVNKEVNFNSNFINKVEWDINSIDNIRIEFLDWGKKIIF